MNKERKNRINEIVEKLEAIYVELEEIEAEEQEAFDNMPERIQWWEKWESMLEFIDCLSNATQSVGESKDFLDDIVNS